MSLPKVRATSDKMISTSRNTPPNATGSAMSGLLMCWRTGPCNCGRNTRRQRQRRSRRPGRTPRAPSRSESRASQRRRRSRVRSRRPNSSICAHPPGHGAISASAAATPRRKAALRASKAQMAAFVRRVLHARSSPAGRDYQLSSDRRSNTCCACRMASWFATAHWPSASIGDHSERPRSVSSYSTRGGMVGNTVRLTQPIPFEAAQGQRQHALRDATDQTLDLVESPRSIAQQADDQHAPFVADPRKDRRHDGAVAGYMGVREFQKCASLRICLAVS